MATSKGRDSRASRGPDPNSKRLAAQRAAEARRRIEEAHRRRRLVTVASAVGAIIVLVAVLVVVKVVSGSDTPKSGTAATAASATVTHAIATVPAAAFDAVGLGDARAAPQVTSGAALTGDGKPRVLYVGAEWCPICAAERWPLAVALARFGAFSGLGQVSSSPSDSYPNTATIAFHGSTYTSRYLTFTPREVESNQISGSHYVTLDSLTGVDKTLFEKAGGGYPFIDLGGTRLIHTTQYDPAVLKGKTQDQIAATLSHPTSTIALSILGSANLITASLCALTKNLPAAVCSSKAVTTATAALPGN